MGIARQLKGVGNTSSLNMKYLNISNMTHGPCPCSWREALTSSILQVAPTWECVFKQQELRTTTTSLSNTQTHLTQQPDSHYLLVSPDVWDSFFTRRRLVRKQFLKKYWHTEGSIFHQDSKWVHFPILCETFPFSIINWIVFTSRGGNDWQNASTINKESLFLTFLWKKWLSKK